MNLKIELIRRPQNGLTSRLLKRPSSSPSGREYEIESERERERASNLYRIKINTLR
jgi:hypothetical protein